MKQEFLESNIVLLGKFSPSKYDKLFFIKNELIKEEKFSEKSIFTPEFSNIITDKLLINVRSNQLLIVNRLDGKIKKSNKIAKIIFENNSEIDAVGFNFKYFIFSDNEIKEHTKKVFYPINSEILNKTFDTKDSAFGYYASKKFLNSRMKLDIKPVLVRNIKDDVSLKTLSFDFNFHIMNKENYIQKSLNEYSVYCKEVNKIISNYE